MATLTKRPANLPDKTYGAPVGYAYFDIFNTGSRQESMKKRNHFNVFTLFCVNMLNKGS